MDKRDTGIALIHGCAYFVLALAIVAKDARMLFMFVAVGFVSTVARRSYER